MYLNLVKNTFLAGLASIFLLACTSSSQNVHSSQKSASTPETKKNKVPVSPAKGPYNPSRTLKNDLLHTRLELSFDWEKQYVHGLATLSFKPYFYPQHTLELDAKGMDIHRIELASTGQELSYKYDSRVLTIALPTTYHRTDTFAVKISYTAKPNELTKQGSAAITDDRGLYFINPDGQTKNKPRQIWTQGETESNSCWFPTIDTPNEKTTQEMYITTDTSFSVLTNGEHIYTRNNSDGTKTEYWKMDQPHAPYLIMMAIGEFKIVKDKWRDIEVSYYVEPSHEKYARNIFGHTPEMLEFFSSKLGVDYPWNKYAQVIVRDFVSGAMENTTASIFMEAVQSDDRELLDEHWDGIIAHELFHHWFGNLVTCESWSNLPLNESLANYSEYLWTEHKYGRDEADLLDVKEEEEYFDEAETKQEPLIRYYYKDKEDMFDRHSYNKGGRIMHMLRYYVGDEAFFESLKYYLNQKQYSTAEIHDLRMAFEHVTGEDLNWFFNQWFMTAGHPELKVSHQYQAGTLTISVSQLQDTTRFPVYRLPLAVDIWENGQPRRVAIMIEKATQQFQFAVSTAPQNVLVDAEFQLLGKIFHDKKDEELFFQYNHEKRYRAREVALAKLFAAKENTPHYNPFAEKEKTALLRKALNDDFWAIRETALEQFSQHVVSSIDDFMEQLEYMALNEPKPVVRARAIYLLASYDLAKYKPVYEQGLKADPYSVVTASLRSYLRTDAADKKDVIKQFESTENGYLLIALSDYYLYTKDLSRYEWMKEKLLSKSGRDLYYILGYFGEYVKLMQGAQREDGKKVIQEIAQSNTHDWIKRIAQKYLKEI
jgi:aminopeptidase N